jgi:hypothetical protein
MKGQAMRLASPRPAPAFFAFVLLAVCATARGEEAAGVWFGQEDWEVACDNTLTCRMVGYCRKADKDAAAVLITRAAGPDAPFRGEVMLLAHHDDGKAGWPPLALLLDSKAQGPLEKGRGYGMYRLAAAEIHALLEAIRQGGAVGFAGDAFSCLLSDRGAAAVLLQADAAQGRIDTPGAFLQKGEKPEENVFPPRPLPVIQAKKVRAASSRRLSAAEVAALKPALLQSKQAACAFDDPSAKTPVGAFTLTPVDAKHVLISTRCWRGIGEGERYAYWIMDSALAGKPEFVTAEANTYLGFVRKNALLDAGELTGLFPLPGKRGGDQGATWVWDGQTFRLTERWMQSGHSWGLRTFVSKVIKEDGTPRYSEPDAPE